MRFRVRRLFGVAALSFVLGLGLAGCSGDQGDDDDGVAADNNNQAGDDNASADGNAAGADDNASGGGNAAAADDNAGDGGGGGDASAESSGGDKAGGTDNDLQEIITEMNGQDGKDGSASGDSKDAQALQQDATGAAPANGGAAAPANGQAAAPAAPAGGQQAAAPAAPAGGKADAQANNGTPPPFQPGGTPAAQGLPEIGSKMAYIVEKGDTLAKISQKIYGANSHWQEMAQLSGISNPSRIFPGDLVYYTLDESAVSFAKAYESIQRSEEQVKQGDTLATIAQRIYGSTTAWRGIWRHNDRIDNPDIVAPGTTVYYVPKGAAAAALNIVKAEMAKVASNNKAHHLTQTLATTAKASKTFKTNNQLNQLSNRVQTKISHTSYNNNYSNSTFNGMTTSNLRLQNLTAYASQT